MMKFTFALSVPAMCLTMAFAQVCNPESKTFTVVLDLFASELGYYKFEECGDKVNPTIGLEIGETYTFIQKDVTNFYHPLGFSYFPDGAHDGVDELEPGIFPVDGASCVATLTCPAPIYLLDGSALGTYSNDPAFPPVSTGEEDFGLDSYEPRFFLPIADWIGEGEFSISLRFDADYDKDIFYFCHIHQFMSGRIKLLRNGNPVSEANDPPLPDGYYQVVGNDFDKKCGTWGLGDFELPHDQCPAQFVCLSDNDASVTNRRTQEGLSLSEYASCTDAMNCHMMAGMTTYASSGSPGALFVHQMVPHHQNAVNMAKSLLKANILDCPDLTDDENPDCVMESVIRSIIVDQNHQIQLMRGYLEAKAYIAEDDCVVPIGSAANGFHLFPSGGVVTTLAAWTLIMSTNLPM